MSRVPCAADGHRRDKNPVHFSETNVMQVIHQWARLGSNQRHSLNAHPWCPMVWRLLAGDSWVARLALGLVSSAWLDPSDGHQKDKTPALVTEEVV